MLRILFLLLLIYICYRALRAYLGLQRRGSQGRADRTPMGGEEMVLDPQCRSYLPKTAALYKHGNYFCSEECATRFLTG